LFFFIATSVVLSFHLYASVGCEGWRIQLSLSVLFGMFDSELTLEQ